MEAQGYQIDDNVIDQDNQSAMLLERNGQASRRWTRHIDIRHFFINDWIRDGDLRIEYCLTADMIGDFFTKPLQGSQFQKLWNLILNVDDDRSST